MAQAEQGHAASTTKPSGTRPRGGRHKVFEHRKQPLLPRGAYYRWVTRFAATAVAFLAAGLLLGVLGPVDPVPSVQGKLFASFYALFSSILFLVAAATLFTPIVHRFFHHFHADIDDDEAGR